MTLYYTRLNKTTVLEWYTDADGQRVEIGQHRIGPNWNRWLSGDVTLCVTMADGRQLTFAKLEEK